MPSFHIAGRDFCQEQDAGLEDQELNALALLRRFTGDRKDVGADRAIFQLGRLRAIMRELEEFNGTFAEGPGLALASYCQARVIEMLASVGRPSGGPVALGDLACLIDAIEAVCGEQIAESRARIAAGSIEYLDLAELYLPGAEVLGPTGGLSQDMGYLVRSCHFEEVSTPFGKKHNFHLELEFFASIGERFSAIRCQEQVGWWRGLREVSGLLLQPLPGEARGRLEQRGRAYAEAAAGRHLLACREGAFLAGRRPGVIRAGRVMVDIAAALESGQRPVLSSHADFAPAALDVQTEAYRRAVRQGRLEKKDPAVQRDEAAGLLIIDRLAFFDAVPPQRLWNCWPMVPAYSLSLKAWGHAEVDGLSAVAWEDGAWDALVLPAGRKALVRAVVQRQREVQGIDVIKGKGEGSTFLLYGPPGTGKTLTAEALAEVLHKPLYVLSAGEMGTTPAEVESTLANALQLCSRWDCICLLDEADIFLEQRNGSDIVRNALVCVMLRQLEYHPGVLFLTTNKAKGIDPAVRSRLTLALRYEPLDEAARTAVWESLLARVGGGPFDVRVLAGPQTNGRQIKNCIRLSLALALDAGAALSQQMLESTLETVCAFQRDLQADEEN